MANWYVLVQKGEHIFILKANYDQIGEYLLIVNAKYFRIGKYLLIFSNDIITGSSGDAAKSKNV